jgi:hypothetical protein
MTTVGYVNSINGKFYARSDDGSVRELKLGDPIYEDDFVYGDNLNTADSLITVSMDGYSELIEVASNDALLFSSTMYDIDSEVPHSDDEDELADVLAKYGDLEETTAGEEGELKDSEAASAFAERAGNMVDINAGLRNVRTSSYQLDHQENENLVVRNSSNQEVFNTITPSPPVTPQTTPPTTTPIVITSPEIIPTIVTPSSVKASSITVDLSGDGLVYEGVDAGYILTLSRPVVSDIQIEITTTHLSTQSTDIAPTVQIITIPKGSSSVSFDISNIDDVFKEPSEDYFVQITNIISQPSVIVEIINDNVTTTIIDDATPDTPAPPPESEDAPTPPPPSDTPAPPPSETVYVQLIKNDSVAEGDILTHGIKLVDEDGTDVMLEQGQSITVTLNYTPSSSPADEGIDYTAQTTVNIVGTIGGNNTAVITNPTLDDYFETLNFEGSIFQNLS